MWISEVMLQQTVVSAVIPFFDRWMERFPDPLVLAEAEEGEVLLYWEGLGYYSRGRNLLKASQFIRDELGGELPGDLAGWRALPGVGEYTARAVLSIACGRPYPVLDANVRRIGRRFLAVRGRRPKEVDGELMSALEECLPTERPGIFNSALMQLGQLVCRTGRPACPLCPLQRDCEADRQGLAHLIPERQKRTITPLESRRFLFFAGEKVFLVRRNGGIGRGLWILPGCPRPPECPPELRGLAVAETPWPTGETPRDPRAITWDQVNVLNRVLSEADRRGVARRSLKDRHHSYTRYQETLAVEAVLVDHAGTLPSLGGLSAVYTGAGWASGWFLRGETENLPMPSIYRKILLEGWASLSLPGRASIICRINKV